jgi:hypothetical protein
MQSKGHESALCADQQQNLETAPDLRGFTQPPTQTGVAFSLVTFFLAKQKKVTSCRATPGGVAFPYNSPHLI